MARVRFLILISLVLISSTFLVPQVSSATGGLQGTVEIVLNVTVVNTAPFPKFLVLNPSYGITVNRLSGNETYPVIGVDSGTVLNYNPGIWLMPYEAVVITFNVTKSESYDLPQVSCGGGDGTYMACGIVVPQLINSPTQLSARSMFPILDGHIRILSYEGTVRFRVFSTDSVPKYFAVTLPVIFVDGEIYGITPNYTMTYGDYKRSLYEYTGLRPQLTGSVQQNVPSLESNMFQLSDTLLTGVKLGGFVQPVPKLEGYDDLPVWFVLTSSGEFEIDYRVEWRGGS